MQVSTGSSKGAQSRTSVFITGGVARARNLRPKRCLPAARVPFVTLNCTAIPRDLMESEIFGHVRGAFTGAHTDRDGATTRVHGGTLFLDKVCEMDLAMQSKLLCFLQTGSFQKVGSGVTERVDIRIASATNRDPLVEVEAGRFCKDLCISASTIYRKRQARRRQPVTDSAGVSRRAAW